MRIHVTFSLTPNRQHSSSHLITTAQTVLHTGFIICMQFCCSLYHAIIIIIIKFELIEDIFIVFGFWRGRQFEQ